MTPERDRKQPVEQEAVRTTIVGGRPPGCGKTIGEIPRGIEVLVKKASVDPEFRRILLAERASAAKTIGLELQPAEVMMLNTVPGTQLEAIIERTVVHPNLKAAFLGRAAAVMLVALGAVSGCERGESTGERADLPPKAEQQLAVRLTVGEETPMPEPPKPPPPQPDPPGPTRGIQPDRPGPVGGSRPDRPAGEKSAATPAVTERQVTRAEGFVVSLGMRADVPKPPDAKDAAKPSVGFGSGGMRVDLPGPKKQAPPKVQTPDPDISRILKASSDTPWGRPAMEPGDTGTKGRGK